MNFKARQKQGHLFPPSSLPQILSFGLGVDSMGCLVGFRQRGERPDLIMFADTGSESKGTYAYLPVAQAWLEEVGFPPVTVVRRPLCNGKHGPYETLYEECRTKKMLPSLAYGNHSCATKWKVEPQHKFLRNWDPAKRAWAAGLPIVQSIGFENEKHEIARCNRLPEDPRFIYRMPLIEWGWDRARCIEEIKGDKELAGIASRFGVPVVPPKSACFFCPSTKPAELIELKRNDPATLELALALERRAAPGLRAIGGLWRRATRTRPASWNEFFSGEKLLTGDEAKKVEPIGEDAVPEKGTSSAVLGLKDFGPPPENKGSRFCELEQPNLF